MLAVLLGPLAIVWAQGTDPALVIEGFVSVLVRVLNYLDCAIHGTHPFALHMIVSKTEIGKNTE